MNLPQSSRGSAARAIFVLAASSLLHAQPPYPRANSNSSDRHPVWEQESSQPSQSNQANRGRFQRVGRNAENFGLVRMAGRPVRSAQGEQLSTIMDFLVNPQSGRVYFAILPSGGGAHGMTYRIVPISAFTGATEDALILRLDRAQWDRVGTLEEWQLKDRVTIDVDHQQRLSQQLGLPRAEIYDGKGPAELVRATTLRGQTIRSDNGQLGRIDDVVVDVTRHELAAVLNMDSSFIGLGVEQRNAPEAQQRFIVPFLELGTHESGAWVSRLRREDFATSEEPHLAAPSADYYYDRSRDQHDIREQRDTRDQRDIRDQRDERNSYPAPAQRNETESAAAAVQRTLERSWPRGRVDVAVEGRHVVLRGMVDTEQDRAEIERAATETARGVRIENQIAVRRR